MSGFVPLDFHERPLDEMRARARAMTELMARRRSTRQFSSRPVPRDLMESAVKTAMTAPSGANLQPWTFVVVQDADLKAKIREAAEQEEQKNYGHRMPDAWLEVLEPLGTDAVKEHITTAPYVVVLFRQTTRVDGRGERQPMYYSQESVGIAAGMFIAALHDMGLVTLTHTPSPMGFLGEILGRPDTEKAYLLMPVGYPAPDATVPDIGRKALDEVIVWK